MVSVKLTLWLCAVLILASATVPLLAQAPSNDTFENATIVSTFPFNSVVDITAATTELDHTCNGRVMYNSVWYRIQPTTDVHLQFDTTGSEFNTLTGIFVTNPWGIGEVGCFDQLVGDQFSWNWSFAGGSSEYYIAVGSSDPSAAGILHLNVAPVTPPSNDDLANATPIDSLPSVTTENTWGATVGLGEVQPSCAWAGNTVWFVYDATYTGNFKIDTADTNYASVVAVYTGSPSSLAEVACDGGYWFSPRVIIPVTAGTRYYILVGSGYTYSGGTLRVSFDVGPPPLTVVIRNIAGSVSPSNGAASVSLTISCSRPVDLFIDGYISQELGRTFSVGSFNSYGIRCEAGTQSVWSGVVSQPLPHAGRSAALFRGGKAVVSVNLSAYDPWYYESYYESANATVRLKAGR